jgi:LysR family transcriptional regulator of abg operon
MKLHYLRNLVAIADTGGIRAASRQLGLAQPALTRSIRDLENDLGAPLLERHGKGVVLTTYGKAFVVRARSILLDLQRGQDEIDHMKGRDGGRVSLGVSSAALLSLVPESYLAFRKSHADTRVKLVEGLFPALEPQLKNGELDFYVGPRPTGSVDKSFSVDLLFKNQRVVVGRVGHPLAQAISLRDLLGADWLMTGLREPVEQEFEEQFAAHGLPSPKALTQAFTMLPIVTLLSLTDALAFLPQQWVNTPLLKPTLQAIPVRETLAGPDIVMIKRAGLPLTPLAEELANLFQRAAGTPFSMAFQPKP